VREKGSSRRDGGDIEEVAAAEATVAARGCHGTTRAEPCQLKGREATGVSVQRWPDGQHREAPEHVGEGVETLAAGGARHGRQRRRPSESRGWRSRSGGVVSLEASGGGGCHRSRRSAARATPGASGAREQEGRPERWSVGLTDRSAGPIWSG
jgi:hypothetical protein